MHTPDQDRKQPLVPPTPARIEVKPFTLRYSILPTLSVIVLIAAWCAGTIEIGWEYTYHLFHHIDFFYERAHPFILAAMGIGIAGILHCLKQRNSVINTLIAVISTFVAALMLTIPMFFHQERY